MRTARKFFQLFNVVCLLAAGMSAAESPLASKKLIQALIDEISGEIAFRYTARISTFDRVQASEGWHEAAVWIKNELDRIGYKDVVIEGWPSNGSTRYYTYKTPIGWKAKKAELWMVSPRRERLCSFEETPLILVKHSHSARVEAELIDVGSGTGEEAYRGRDVKGKIVLSTGASSGVMREAVMKRGALGVITYYPPEVRPGFPDMIRYTAFWPTWEEREKVGFGFNVSKNQGAVLKGMLERGQKIVLKAEVEALFYETRVEVLSAALRGSVEPDREVMIVGHLCHASGSGGMLEMARALKNMVDKGLIEPPRRTIRFLWVPEFAGTVPEVKAHLERTRNTLAVINCDMIGEDLHLTGGMFNITVTPDSVPSYLNDVVVNFAGLIDSLGLRSLNGSDHPFAYRVVPFGGGSDHYIFNDGALRVPAVMFGHDDTFHHTSLDSIDKVDASELRRVCSIALGSTIYLAGAQEPEAKDMARLITRNGLGRLAADYYDALRAVAAADNGGKLFDAAKQAMNVIERSTAREKEAVYSATRFGQGPEFKNEIAGFLINLDALGRLFKTEVGKTYRSLCLKFKVQPQEIAPTQDEKKFFDVVPVRAESFVCPLETDYLVEKLGSDAVGQIRLRGNAAYEALNFVDGKRSVYDITKAVSAEYGPQKVEDIFGFFQVLEKAELVKLTVKK
jgi:aminopeptidase-like protein